MAVEFVPKNGVPVAIIASGDLVVLDSYPGEMDYGYLVARVVDSKTVRPFTTGTILDEPVPGELVSERQIDTDLRLRGSLGRLRFIPDN